MRRKQAILMGVIGLLLAVSIAVTIPTFADRDPNMLGPLDNNVSEFLFTLITNISPGTASLSWSNNVSRPWKLGSVMFRLPSGVTNDFTIDVVHVDEEIQRQGNVVITNAFGEAETNYYSTITNINYTYVTNRLLTDSTTNVQSILYGPGDYSQYKYMHPGNMLLFTWSYTNAARYLFLDALR